MNFIGVRGRVLGQYEKIFDIDLFLILRPGPQDTSPLLVAAYNLTKAQHISFFVPQVNIVPVIAKSDTLTKKEVKAMKERILREISANDIRIYQFPENDDDDVSKTQINLIIIFYYYYILYTSNIHNPYNK